MIAVDTVELRRLALKADTPSPWETGASSSDGAYSVWHDSGHLIFLGFDIVSEFSQGDAEFIAAANPEAMLALLDEIDVLRAAASTRDRATK